MYTLSRSLPKRQLLLEQAPIIASSLAIAELFYKFHSFLLECTAFLATWFVIDVVVRMAVDGRSRVRGVPATVPGSELHGSAPSPHHGA